MENIVKKPRDVLRKNVKIPKKPTGGFKSETKLGLPTWSVSGRYSNLPCQLRRRWRRHPGRRRSRDDQRRAAGRTEPSCVPRAPLRAVSAIQAAWHTRPTICQSRGIRKYPDTPYLARGKWRNRRGFQSVAAWHCVPLRPEREALREDFPRDPQKKIKCDDFSSPNNVVSIRKSPLFVSFFDSTTLFSMFSFTDISDVEESLKKRYKFYCKCLSSIYPPPRDVSTCGPSLDHADLAIVYYCLEFTQ